MPEAQTKQCRLPPSITTAYRPADSIPQFCLTLPCFLFLSYWWVVSESVRWQIVKVGKMVVVVVVVVVVLVLVVVGVLYGLSMIDGHNCFGPPSLVEGLLSTRATHLFYVLVELGLSLHLFPAYMC